MNRAVIAGLLCLSTLACSSEQKPQGPCTSCKPGTGGVSIGFPLTSADVLRVVATVTGTGIPAPITSELTITGSTASGVIKDIPVGTARTVAISAYPAVPGDAESSVVIYRGQTDVEILAGQLAQASITLLPVNGDVAVTATFPAGDIDVPRVHHVSVAASGTRITTPATFYLVPNLPAFNAAGTAQKTPVGDSRVITVKSFTSDGTLLHQGTATVPVTETDSSASVTLTNATGAGGANVGVGFCVPNCTSPAKECGPDGCNGSCGGCIPGVACIGGACLATFDLTGASASSPTSLTVTYSEAATAGEAGDPASYCIALGTPPSCTGDVAVTGVTGSGTTWGLTTATQTPSTGYTVFVSNVTRASDGMALNVHSKPFTSVTAFNVTGAVANSATSVTVSFSDGANAAAGTSTNYCIAAGTPAECSSDIGVTGVTGSGSSWTLTTASQLASTTYTVFVTNVARASDGAALSAGTASYTSFPAFNVTNAVALSNTSLEVTYSHNYASGPATAPGSYLIADATGPTDCTGGLAPTLAASTAGNKVALTTTGLAGNKALRVCVTGAVTRALDGAGLSTASRPFAQYNLITNGSFETDTAAPPHDWIEVGPTGVLTAMTSALPVPFHGLNVAKFSTLSNTTGADEAASSCFLIDHTKTVSITARMLTPEPVANTTYSFKLLTFTDTACASSVTGPNASTSTALLAPNTWEQHGATFTPGATANSARATIRGRFVAPGTASSVFYYDDVIVIQP